jgi:hypothetical protein
MNKTGRVPFQEDSFDPKYYFVPNLPYHIRHHVWKKPVPHMSHSHIGLEISDIRAGRGVFNRPAGNMICAPATFFYRWHDAAFSMAETACAKTQMISRLFAPLCRRDN